MLKYVSIYGTIIVAKLWRKWWKEATNGPLSAWTKQSDCKFGQVKKIFLYGPSPATFCLFSSFQTNTRPRIPPWKIFLKSTLLFHPSSTLCSFGFQIRKLYIVLSMKASRHRISVLGKIQESQLLYGSDVIAIATKTNERG